MLRKPRRRVNNDPISVPRVFTDDEVRDALLEHIWVMIRYWQNIEKPLADRLEGLAFSILAMLDGSSVAITGFQVIPAPHKEDAAFHKEHGENWFPYSKQQAHDIGGGLHELFHDVGRKLGYLPREEKVQ
jgi:hypothetical protein